MRFLMVLLVVAVVGSVLLLQARKVLGRDVIKDPSASPSTQPAGVLDFTMKDIDGKDVNLADYRGKVVMFVNVASKCGFTPQYEGLEKTYEKYKDKGFVIIGFPANNFKSQEPGSDAEIKQFCTSKYNVTFPMMSKISVKGDDIHPLYKKLTTEDGDFNGEIGWNFTKFLVDKNGQVYARFASKTKPDDAAVTQAIEKGLGQ